jgi:hypothetical protein
MGTLPVEISSDLVFADESLEAAYREHHTESQVPACRRARPPPRLPASPARRRRGLAPPILKFSDSPILHASNTS